MKFTTILLLACCLAASAAGNAQRISINLKAASLEKVFKEIKKQTGYTFVYRDEWLQGAKKVDLNLKDVSLEQALDACFKDLSLTYTIVKTTIVIQQKEKSPVPPLDKGGAEGGEFDGTQPPIDVTGRIVNEAGDGVIATVTVKGTRTAVTTDDNGFFTIKGVDENATLVITATNIEGRELNLSSFNKGGAAGGGLDLAMISVKMKVTAMNEVIINKGYYTEKQRNTLGNVTHIDAKTIEKSPVQNVLLALQGRVPGMEVTQLTGMNGGGVKVRIQGQNSIRSGLNPLIVVDGVPFPSELAGSSYMEQYIVQGGSPLNYINPNDIESIDILKDADATSIYGSRAANGAILISTKKGKAGKTKLTLNLQQGWGKVTRTVNMLKTQQYLEMRREAFRNSNQIPNLSTAPDLLFWDTTRYTNWQKKLIGGTAKYTNISATVSGGTQTIQYLVGGTYNRQTTVFPGDFEEQAGNLHFNINSASNNQRLRMQLTGSYGYNSNHLPSTDLTQIAYTLEPNAPDLYNPDGTLNWAQDPTGTSTWDNPLQNIENSDFVNTTKNLVSNILINYKIFKGFEFRSSIGYNNTQSQIYTPLRLEYYKPEQRPNQQRFAGFGNRNMSSWIVEPQVFYTGKIGNGKIEGLLGTTIQKSSFDYLSVYGFGFPTDELMKTLLAATSTYIWGSTSGTTRYNAAFLRLNYNLSDKWLLNLTTRRDGSNKFGDNNKFNNFWSVGAGWIFSNEKWIERNLSFLSFGKIRASYGVTGNDQIPDFAYLSIYNINNPTILYQGNIGLRPNNIPNPYLQWEKTSKFQAGIDLGVFQDRINVGLTYAQNRSSNQLINYILPDITGFSSITKNLPATIRNTSLELLFNSINIKSKHFSWSSSFNITIPNNKLVSFPGIEKTPYANSNDGIIVGQPLGVKKVYRFAGLNSANGLPLVIDRNGNPTNNTSSANRDVFISQLTDYYGGIVNTIHYKGFQLDFLLQFVRKKGQRDLFWYNGVQGPGQFYAGYSNQPFSVLNRWQKPGDVGINVRYLSTGFNGSVRDTDAFYSYDASFVRLKNISFSWEVPTSWLQKNHIQNALIYFRGQNLFTKSHYTGLDPETGSSSLPPLQMWTLGATIGF